ncbi:MAG: L-threonylcarbamoyladenylate synthase, partial [Cytophagales bacterium]
MIGNSIAIAAGYLKEGFVVGIPTKTVYGLAGNAFCERALTRIFKIKRRPYEDPLIVHCAHKTAVLPLVSAWPQEADMLAKAFWPGALTLLLPKRDLVPGLVTAGRSRVAVRVPSHPMTQRLLQALSFPLAAPSANPFGYISPTTAHHVADQLGDALPYILDGGAAALGLESTIVGFDRGEVIVYRLGGISVEAIE